MSPPGAVVVLDCGAHSTKCGVAGRDANAKFVRTVVGRPVGGTAIDGREVFVGDDVGQYLNRIELTEPVDRGRVVDWNNMKKVWNHVFAAELHVAPSEHTVLIAEPVNTVDEDREKIAEVMYEQLRVPSLCLCEQAPLAMRRAGYATGLVVDIGQELATVTPVHEGRVVAEARQQQALAGDDLAEHMVRLLHANNPAVKRQNMRFNKNSDKEAISDMKNRLCYVAGSYKKELHVAQTTRILEAPYEFPDGNEIVVEMERFTVPEILFNPAVAGKLTGSRYKSVQALAAAALLACEEKARRRMCDAVVLCGGTTMFDGFEKRFGAELGGKMKQAGYSGTKQLQTVASGRPRTVVWRGAVNLAMSDAFAEHCVTSAQFKEQGNRAVHKRR